MSQLCYKPYAELRGCAGLQTTAHGSYRVKFMVQSKGRQNFSCGHTEWVASSKQAAVSLHLSWWSSRAASQVSVCHSKLFAKLYFHLKAEGNQISITNCSHYSIKPQSQRAWSGGFSGLTVVPDHVYRFSTAHHGFLQPALPLPVLQSRQGEKKWLFYDIITFLNGNIFLK